MNCRLKRANTGKSSFCLGSLKACAGLTLVEVVISLAVAGIAMGAIISGYVLGARQMQWTAQNDAAQTSAVNALELVRSARWDRRVHPQVDQLVASNFPNQVSVFNLPSKGTNVTTGTNFVTITHIADEPPLKFIRVDCVWRSSFGRMHTNTATTFRSPEQ